jgi:hypothetical protein
MNAATSYPAPPRRPEHPLCLVLSTLSGSSTPVHIEFREVAATCTVASHNCSAVLDALAATSGHPSAGSLASVAGESAKAVAQVRAGWLHVARELKQFTTDTRGYLSPVAAESADLTLWTGRLAHASPHWTLAAKPPTGPRFASKLSAQLRDVVAAMHQASETIATLARTEQERARIAAEAGRPTALSSSPRPQ